MFTYPHVKYTCTHGYILLYNLSVHYDNATSRKGISTLSDNSTIDCVFRIEISPWYSVILVINLPYIHEY